MKLTSATWFTIIAMSFFTLCTLYVVMAEPIIGLADNGDFYRVTNKEGIKHREDTSYYDRYYHYPVRKFELAKPQTNAGDYNTSFSIMIKTSLLLNKMTGDSKLFDIRFMGLTNAIFFLFAIFLVLLSIRNFPFYLKLCIGLMLFTMFVDINRICYFNSFYAESSSLFFLVLTLSLSLLLVFEPLSRRRTIVVAAAFLFSSFLLSSSKQQHALLIFPLALWVVIFFIYKSKKNSEKIIHVTKNNIVVFAIALFTIAASVHFFFSTGNANKQASLYNVVFFSLLPHAKDPQQALVDLGLDNKSAEKYKEYSGTWSWPKDEKTIVQDSEFRAVFFTKVDIIDVIRYYIFHPQEYMRLAAERSKYYGKAKSDYLEYFEKTEEPSPRLRYVAFTGWSNFKENLGIDLKALMGFYFFNFGLLAIKFFKFDKSEKSRLISWLHLAIILMSILEFFVCTIGDRGDDTKHYFLFSVMLDLCLIFIVVYMMLLVVAYFKALPQS